MRYVLFCIYARTARTKANGRSNIVCKNFLNDKAEVFYFSAVSYFNVLLGVLTCIVDKVYTEIASEIAKGKKKF